MEQKIIRLMVAVALALLAACAAKRVPADQARGCPGFAPGPITVTDCP
jgi:hypothetical protein